MIATTPALLAHPGQHCHTTTCAAKAKAREYAANHGGCYSPRCTTRVRAKRDIREIRRLTPYRCHFGRSAIPCAIVMCESHGRWTAYNRSGAAGIYQIMPVHHRPWPANTRAARLAHHRIAARLWNGGRGARNWVCA